MSEWIKPNAIMVPNGYGPMVAKAFATPLYLLWRGEAETDLKFANARVILSGLELAYFSAEDESPPQTRFKTIALFFNAGWATASRALSELEAWAKATALDTYPRIGIDTSAPDGNGTRTRTALENSWA